jgi:hypothetical protein
MRKITRKDKEREDYAIDEVYDREEDIYYVTLKTGEPSYCMEIDDILIAEVGMFTNSFTGFRVLNFNRNRTALNEMFLAGRLKQEIKQNIKSGKDSRQAREAAFEQALGKVLA